MGKVLDIEAERRRKLVDELGAINVSRAESIKKEIREVWMVNAKPDESQSFPGHRYVATVTARKLERTVNTRVVYKFKGIRWLLEWCKIPVGVVEDHIALPNRKGMISESQTGSRSVSIAPLAQPVIELEKAA